MKPEDIIGAKVVDAEGKEGFGCQRCGVDPGQLQLRSLCLQIATGERVILVVDSVCPPDMETGQRKQRMVCVGVVSA